MYRVVYLRQKHVAKFFSFPSKIPYQLQQHVTVTRLIYKWRMQRCHAGAGVILHQRSPSSLWAQEAEVAISSDLPSPPSECQAPGRQRIPRLFLLLAWRQNRAKECSSGNGRQAMAGCVGRLSPCATSFIPRRCSPVLDGSGMQGEHSPCSVGRVLSTGVTVQGFSVRWNFQAELALFWQVTNQNHQTQGGKKDSAAVTTFPLQLLPELNVIVTRSKEQSWKLKLCVF